jgi:6,7-dimethyl-8-ribityllumazine synthase
MAGRAPRVHRRDRPGPCPPDTRFAVVAGRFNERIVKRLLEGAERALASGGVPADAIDVHWVPGSFELPQAAAVLARSGRYAGIVCVGCVIKGETPHFDFVAGQAAAGIQRVALDTGVPTTFGVITALTEAQALARAGGDVGNRGQEAADAALEMAAFMHAHGREGNRMTTPKRGLKDRRGGGALLGQRRALADSTPDRRGDGALRRQRRPLAGSTPDRRGGGALRSRPGGK